MAGLHDLQRSDRAGYFALSVHDRLCHFRHGMLPQSLADSLRVAGRQLRRCRKARRPDDRPKPTPHRGSPRQAADMGPATPCQPPAHPRVPRASALIRVEILALPRTAHCRRPIRHRREATPHVQRDAPRPGPGRSAARGVPDKTHASLAAPSPCRRQPRGPRLPPSPPVTGTRQHPMPSGVPKGTAQVTPSPGASAAKPHAPWSPAVSAPPPNPRTADCHRACPSPARGNTPCPAERPMVRPGPRRRPGRYRQNPIHRGPHRISVATDLSNPSLPPSPSVAGTRQHPLPSGAPRGPAHAASPSAAPTHDRTSAPWTARCSCRTTGRTTANRTATQRPHTP